MYLLKKIFQLRDHVNQEAEKPFLEHLEDLRIMVTRVVITLLISMVVCFTFNEQLMAVLRRPVDRLWVANVEEQLPTAKEGAPKPLSVERWEEAKALERAAAGLTDSQRAAFYQACGDEELVFHVQAAALLRAAQGLPESSRTPFVQALDDDPALKAQVLALLAKSKNHELEGVRDRRMMSALRPTETFMLSMKLSFFAGIVVSFPLLLLFVLQFVTPGLHSHEKKMLWPALAIGFGLFLGGVCFAYFAVLPRALEFFYEWSTKLGVSNDWRIGEYITFATQFTLLFGLSFELPVVVMVMVKLGLLSYETMARTRSYAIVAIFVAAAIMTPTPDVLTLMLMALPMIALYEICIWLAWWDRRNELRREEAEARERMERLLTGREPEVDDEASAFRSASEEVAEPGDDGWHDDPWQGQEIPHTDPHAGIEPADPPEPPDSPLAPPPDSVPEAEERRRFDG
jgi:sec-independent protein translocase protein TatC